MKHPLILLFGMSRSGTTWLGKIFDSHPDTLYRHEPDSRAKLNAMPLFAFTQNAEDYRDYLQAYIERLPSIRDEKVSASLPIFDKSYLHSNRLLLHKCIVLSLKTASRFYGSLPVPHLVNFDRHPEINIVWKSIESMGRLGVLASLYPEAHCILILRHPCGYVASVLRGEAKRKFESAQSTSEDWGLFQKLLELPAAKERGFELATIKSMTPVERLALQWALYYEHALSETAELKNILNVRYEDFCHYPMKEAEKAFQHCNLPWSKQTENFIVKSTSHQNDNYYSVYKDPVAAAMKWQQELTPDEIQKVMQTVSGFAASKYYTEYQHPPPNSD